MIYLFVFFISIFFARISDVQRNRNSIHLVSLILSMLPLILLATFRTEEIGTDTSLYPVTIYEFIRGGADFSDLLTFSLLVEPLYYVLVHITYHYFSNSFTAILFVQHFIIIVCFYIAFYRMRRYVSLTHSVFIFCFLFYNSTLNIQRQSMALGFVFIGYTFLIENKIRIFLIYLLVAFCMHRSAIFALILLPIIYVKSVRLDKYYIFGALLILLLYPIIFENFMNIVGLQKYEQYANDGHFEGFFSYSEFILRVGFISILWFLTPLKMKDENYYNVLTLFLCEFFINITQIYSRFIGRMGLYAFVLYISYIPYYCFRKVNGHKNYMAIAGVYALILFYWWYVYVFTQAGDTYPYKSVL